MRIEVRVGAKIMNFLKNKNQPSKKFQILIN